MSLPTPSLSFKGRLAASFANPNLRIALDRATDKFTANRQKALASLEGADAVRDLARSIRAYTLAHLPDMLEQFEASVKARGGVVHWAATAAEANAAVVALAKSRGVKRIVKGKSMVSEETHLNTALEGQGFEVIESDLGEYIIQLSGETPSHIIVPAVHKTKEEIGLLLHQKLGVPLTHVPEEMAAVAREKLREVFLTADMGISGVNFGVADTGTLALLENEGNGRLSTSLPPIHVALMGVERLVPSLEDLTVMLSVLSRSATGQKLTVYNNWIHGPRGPGEADGPGELHVVLVDNGRSQVLASAQSEILYCIRCGACLNACPVYHSIGGHGYGSVYPGPVGAVLTPSLDGVAKWKELPHASSLCGACKEVCPVRIDIPRMLLNLRAEGHEKGKTPLWLRVGIGLFRFVAIRPALFQGALKMASFGSKLFTRGGRIAHLPLMASGWTKYRDFPAFPKKSFGALMAERKKP